MRSTFATLSAFASLAVANPLGYGYDNGGYNAYPTGGKPSSSEVVPSPSSAGYAVKSTPASTPSSSAVYEHYSVPAASSSSPVYEHYSAPTPASSSVVYSPGYSVPAASSSASSSVVYGHGYSVPTPSASSSSVVYGTGYSVPTPGSSSSSVKYGHGYSAPVPPYSASVPVYSASVPAYSASVPVYSASVPAHNASVPAYSASVPAYSASSPVPYATHATPYGTGYSVKPSTTEYTTYTTTTVCPVTKTYGTQIVTTETTSTVTVTACKNGCHPETYASSTPAPSKYEVTPPKDVTTTYIQTTYAWIPVSTPVGQTGYNTIYSTYLTPSYYTQTVTSTIYGCNGKTCPTPAAPVYPAGTPPVYSEAPKPVYPAGTPPVYSEAPKPVYSEAPKPVHSEAPKPVYPAGTPVPIVPDNCPAPVTKTVYLDSPAGTPVAGYTTKVITVTEEGHAQTYTVSIPQAQPTYPIYPGESKPSPSAAYSHPAAASSWVPYPIVKPSSAAPSVKPTNYAQYTPSAVSSVEYPANTPSSSVGYPVPVSSSSAKYPVNTPSPSSKPTPVPTGYPSYTQY
jgi:hypothetical protein